MSEENCSFEHLEGHRYARLTTYRKSGEPVPIPVWFAVVGVPDNRIYVFTDALSGKAKRIRNDPQGGSTGWP
jgi:PPOX class probable F420-dependent enzyme